MDKMLFFKYLLFMCNLHVTLAYFSVSMSDKISQARTGVRYIADWAEKRGSRYFC